MVHAELSVVRYRPLAHSKAHWALHLHIVGGDESKQHFIYQANGEPGALALDVVEANPMQSQRFREEIFVCEIDGERAIAEVKECLRRQPMRNAIATWTCQDWVMESLETLNDEMLVDEYQYAEAKEKLETAYHN